MAIKKILINFLNKSRADLIFYLTASLFIFIFYWEFNFLKIFGILFSILGFVIWITGIIHLGTSFHALPRAKKLVTSGIYSKIRNPIYFGGALVSLGLVIYVWGIPILFLILLILFILGIIMQYFRIKAEEKVLTNKFGNEYLKYKEKTWF